MKEESGIAYIKTIFLRSFELLRKHWVLYFIPLLYLVIGGIIISAVGFFIAVIVYASTIVMMIETRSLKEFFTVLASGAATILILFVLLGVIFLSGYMGGLGFLLRDLLINGKIDFGIFKKGVIHGGIRLFFGFIVMIIMLILPFYWGTLKLLHMYGIYDFATMQSGWNFSLRQDLREAHANVVLLTYFFDLIIAILLSFWWIISIVESRHFITSFIKSIAFFLKKPASVVMLILSNFIFLYMAVFLFGALSKFLGGSRELGSLIGLYLFIPLTMLTMMQFYNPHLDSQHVDELKPTFSGKTTLSEMMEIEK